MMMLCQIHREGIVDNVPHGWKLKPKNSHNWGRTLGRIYLGDQCTHGDEMANPSKKATFSFRQGETTSMPPPYKGSWAK
jgi:hypothetical protein